MWPTLVHHVLLPPSPAQFVEKDPKLAEPVLRQLLKFWPLTNSQKEVLFLGELEEVLELTQPAEFQAVMEPLFRQLARCLTSAHFQVGAGGQQAAGILMLGGFLHGPSAGPSCSPAMPGQTPVGSQHSASCLALQL